MKIFLPGIFAILMLMGCAYVNKKGNRYPRSSSAFEAQAKTLVKQGDRLDDARRRLSDDGFYISDGSGPGIWTHGDHAISAVQADIIGPRFFQWIIILQYKNGRVTNVSPKYESGWALDF